MNNCTNCSKPVDTKNAILCTKCYPKYKDVFPTNWKNQRSFTMNYGFLLRTIGLIINLAILIIGWFSITGTEILLIGSIPSSIGFPFLIGGIVGLMFWVWANE